MDSSSPNENLGRAISDRRQNLLKDVTSGCRNCAKMIIYASDLAQAEVRGEITADESSSRFGEAVGACLASGPTFDPTTQNQDCHNPRLWAEYPNL